MSDKHLQFVAAYGPKQAIKSFDALVPIGTPCEVRGLKTKTWSHAMYGPRRVPVVFVEAFQEAVGLHELSIDGIEMVPQRRLAKEELRGKGMISKSVDATPKSAEHERSQSDGEVHQGKLF